MWRDFNAITEVWKTGSESFHLSPRYILCTLSSLGTLGCAWSAFLLYSHRGLMSHSSIRHTWKPHIKRQWFENDWIKDQQPRSPTALSWRLCMKNTTATKRKNSVSTFLFPMHSLDKSVVELKLKKKKGFDIHWFYPSLSKMFAFKKRKIVFCGWKTFTKSFKVEQWHSEQGNVLFRINTLQKGP